MSTAVKKIITLTSTDEHLVIESRGQKGAVELNVLNRDDNLGANLLSAVEEIMKAPTPPAPQPTRVESVIQIREAKQTPQA